MFARCLSSLKSERVEASRVLNGPPSALYDGDRKEMVEDIKLVRSKPILLLVAMWDHSPGVVTVR